jgi:hypothetical protein
MIQKISNRYFYAIIPLFLILDVVLGVAVYHGYRAPGKAQTLAPPAPAPNKEIKMPELPAIQIAASGLSIDTDSVLDKNLFSPERALVRGPAAPAPTAQEAPAPEKSQFELVGILLTPTRRRAFLSNRKASGDTPKKRWLEQGENCWGIKLADVGRDKVTIETQPRKTFTLDLYDPYQKKDRGEIPKAEHKAATAPTTVTVAPPASSAPPKGPPQHKATPAGAQPGKAESGKTKDLVEIVTPFGNISHTGDTKIKDREAQKKTPQSEKSFGAKK